MPVPESNFRNHGCSDFSPGSNICRKVFVKFAKNLFKVANQGAKPRPRQLICIIVKDFADPCRKSTNLDSMGVNGARVTLLLLPRGKKVILPNVSVH